LDLWSLDIANVIDVAESPFISFILLGWKLYHIHMIRINGIAADVKAIVGGGGFFDNL